MSASDLTTYISAQRASGVSDASIRAALLAKGWPTDEVNAALGSRIAPAPVFTSARPARTGTKLALTLALAAFTGVYALWQIFGASTSSAAVLPSISTNQPSSSQPPAQNTTASASPPPSSSTNKTTPQQTPAPAAPPKPKGQYADGSYTGSVADAFYGNVQVKAVVQNGRLANVVFLQYPNDRQTSLYISQQAMPYLTQEAIQAQSAQVDGVSGATDTSRAFVQSLSVALAKAKA